MLLQLTDEASWQDIPTTDSHIHPEDTSALLVKHGQELFARGDFFMAFLMIMLPHK